MFNVCRCNDKFKNKKCIHFRRRSKMDKDGIRMVAKKYELFKLRKEKAL